jgi:hypothetical protein
MRDGRRLHKAGVASALPLLRGPGKFLVNAFGGNSGRTTRIWMQQWRNAAIALRNVKRQELGRMTEEDVLNACDLLLEDAISFYRSPKTVKNSGLVEQQRLFARARQKV